MIQTRRIINSSSEMFFPQPLQCQYSRSILKNRSEDCSPIDPPESHSSTSDTDLFFDFDNEKNSSDEDDNVLHFVNNDKEHIVEKQKLSDLLSCLEMDKELGSKRVRNEFKRKEDSLCTIVASPVNFSFLTPALQLKAEVRAAELFTSNSKSRKISEDKDVERSKVTELRRSSSLKSANTSERANINQRKIVRFADVFGLDLTYVKTFMDEIPQVPKSAYRDLRNDKIDRFTVTNEYFTPNFIQPGNTSSFFSRLSNENVLLENAKIVGGSQISGSVRVMNLDFYKIVTVRYTNNDWKSCCNVDASFTNHDGQHNSDIFSFRFSFNEKEVKRLQFCIRYFLPTNQKEFWDNNHGNNYTFEKKCSIRLKQDSKYIYDSQSPLNLTDDPWLRFM